MRVSAIFDDLDAVFGGEGHENIEVCKSHAEMYREKSFGLRSDCLFHKFRVETIGGRVDVDKNRDSVDQQDGTDCALPGIGGNYDFIARPYVDRFEGGLNGYGSGVHCLAIFR